MTIIAIRKSFVSRKPQFRLTTSLTTIVITWFAQNATSGNTTDGNSTEMLAPSEEGGWG